MCDISIESATFLSITKIIVIEEKNREKNGDQLIEITINKTYFTHKSQHKDVGLGHSGYTRPL